MVSAFRGEILYESRLRYAMADFATSGALFNQAGPSSTTICEDEDDGTPPLVRVDEVSLFDSEVEPLSSVQDNSVILQRLAFSVRGW